MVEHYKVTSLEASFPELTTVLVTPYKYALGSGKLTSSDQKNSLYTGLILKEPSMLFNMYESKDNVYIYIHMFIYIYTFFKSYIVDY